MRHFLAIFTSLSLHVFLFELTAGLFLVCSSTQSAVLKKFVQFYSVKCAVGNWTIYL